MHRPRLTYANVASTLALVLAASGVGWAATLPAGSVGTTQLRPASVTASRLAANAVSSPKVADGSLAGADIAPGTVGASRLAPHAVTTSRLANGAVTALKLGPAAVGVANLSPAALDALAPYAISQRNATIQNVGTNQVTVATVPIPKPGRWLMTVELRAFPCTSSSCPAAGHNLNCSVSGVGGDGVSITNVTVPTQTGTSQIVFSGIIAAGDRSVASLNCRQILGTGLITLSYRITAVKVVVP